MTSTPGRRSTPAARSSPLQRSSRFPARRAAFLVAVVLAAASPWRPGASSDGAAVFRTAASLAFERTFVLPKAPPGATIDPFYFPPSPDGSGVVAVYAPFGALLGAVFLLSASLAPSPAVAGALADVLASLAPIVATSLAVLPLARLLRLGGARRRAAPWLAVALVVGTFLGPLGVSDFQEPWLVLFVAQALDSALVSRMLRGVRREKALALAGLMLSAAVLAKPTAAALLSALALPALFPRGGEGRARGVLALGLAAVPGVALALALNVSRFGSPLATGYETPLLHPLARAVSPAWTVLRLTFLPNRGLLWYAPLLLLFPLVLPRLLRGRRRTVLATAVLGFGVFFAANVAWFAWEGGLGWAPRLLAPAVACAAPLLAARGSTLRIAAVLALLGAAVNLPAYLLDPGRFYRVVVTKPDAEALGPVVPIHRAAGGAGRLFPEQKMHYVLKFAPVFVGPEVLARLLTEGDGPSAGGTGAARTRDAAVLRLVLGQPRGEGSETGRLLLSEAWATAGSDPERAARMARRAAEFGAYSPR